MKLLESRRQVCAEIEKYKPDLREFQFVILKGSLEIVTDPLEREAAIGKIGFRKKDNWSSFTPAKPLMTVKLTHTTESGLRSP